MAKGCCSISSTSSLAALQATKHQSKIMEIQNKTSGFPLHTPSTPLYVPNSKETWTISCLVCFYNAHVMQRMKKIWKLF